MSKKPVFLYVEDDPLSREVLQMILEQGLGYTDLFMFEDSLDFLQRIAALPALPDVVFLDVHVQPADGFALLQMLRAEERYQNLRVVAVTASVMNEEIAQLKQAGFNGAIGKPLDLDTFSELVRQILDGREVWSVM